MRIYFGFVHFKIWKQITSSWWQWTVPQAAVLSTNLECGKWGRSTRGSVLQSSLVPPYELHYFVAEQPIGEIIYQVVALLRTVSNLPIYLCMSLSFSQRVITFDSYPSEASNLGFISGHSFLSLLASLIRYKCDDYCYVCIYDFKCDKYVHKVS